MRGSPLWQIVAVVLMFAAAAVPVVRLTAPAARVAAVSPALATKSASAPVSLEIEAAFIPAPTDFKLSYLGETVVLSGDGPTTDFNGRFSVPIPPDGVDLALQAHWPETATGHVAAHLTVRLPDGREITRTFWRDAGQSMVETFTIKP